MAWLDVATAPASTVPVCRFFGAPGVGPSSHVFTANPAECAALKADPHWVYEGIAFRALPLVGGACPAGTVAVNRLWKPGATVAASRHRLVVEPAKVATLVAFEGYTLEGPVFCALPS
jgi:serine protease